MVTTNQQNIKLHGDTTPIRSEEGDIMREFLKGLELDKETIDTIMAEHGKRVTEDKELITQLESEVKSYKDKIVELEEVSKDSAKIQEELTTLKTQLEEETAKKEQEERDNS